MSSGRSASLKASACAVTCQHARIVPCPMSHFGSRLGAYAALTERSTQYELQEINTRHVASPPPRMSMQGPRQGTLAPDRDRAGHTKGHELSRDMGVSFQVSSYVGGLAPGRVLNECGTGRKEQGLADARALGQ